MRKIKHTNEIRTQWKKKISAFAEIIWCPYEDEALAFWMKLVFEFMWIVNILNGVFYHADKDYFFVLLFMIVTLAINLILCRKHRRLKVDVITFFLLSILVGYIYYHACIGYFSMMFLPLYGCGVIFILGIRDSLYINIGYMALILLCFRTNQNPLVQLRYGENNVLRFPYLFVCIILIGYCLMYIIQKYWVQKKKRMQILWQRIHEEQKQLDTMLMKVMNAMVDALDAKIPGKKEHCRSVAEYAREIAVRKGLDEQMCMEAYNAGLLHEIGMIGIPDALIKKETLTEEEYAVFQTYVEKGYEIIRTLQSSDTYITAEAVFYHRENYDGSGFPKGLAGDEIPELAQILAIADYTDRHLRRAESIPMIIQQLLALENKDFAPEVVFIMIQLLEEKIVE